MNTINQSSVTENPRIASHTPDADTEHLAAETIDEGQRASNQAAKELILQWLEDDSGYDEKSWPILKEAIEKNRLSNRSRFHK